MITNKLEFLSLVLYAFLCTNACFAQNATPNIEDFYPSSPTGDTKPLLDTETSQPTSPIFIATHPSEETGCKDESNTALSTITTIITNQEEAVEDKTCINRFRLYLRNLNEERSDVLKCQIAFYCFRTICLGIYSECSSFENCQSEELTITLNWLAHLAGDASMIGTTYFAKKEAEKDYARKWGKCKERTLYFLSAVFTLLDILYVSSQYNPSGDSQTSKTFHSTPIRETLFWVNCLASCFYVCCLWKQTRTSSPNPPGGLQHSSPHVI